MFSLSSTFLPTFLPSSSFARHFFFFCTFRRASKNILLLYFCMSLFCLFKIKENAKKASSRTIVFVVPISLVVLRSFLLLIFSLAPHVLLVLCLFVHPRIQNQEGECKKSSSQTIVSVVPNSLAVLRTFLLLIFSLAPHMHVRRMQKVFFPNNCPRCSISLAVLRSFLLLIFSSRLVPREKTRKEKTAKTSTSSLSAFCSFSVCGPHLQNKKKTRPNSLIFLVFCLWPTSSK
jgi:hypothetical protein